MTSPALLPVESIPLLTAWVSRLGEDLKIRTLIIKGPLMTSQGLRGEHVSNDVDAWVDPARFADLVAALERHGWYRVFSGARHTILPQHSATLRHAKWACELDVHERIPGFFAEPGSVFDSFWERRTSAAIAGVGVSTPDRVGNAAVLAVNQVRDLHSDAGPGALEPLAAVVRGFDVEETAAWARLVAASGANQTLAPLMTLAGVSSVPGVEASPQQVEDWRVLRATQHAPASEWMVALRRARPGQWPALVWRAFWLNEVEVRQVEPGFPPGPWGLFKARLHRLSRGLKGLPAATRVILLRRER
jgi:hypothetical protein